ncbi:MAG TPA: hypothetical protein VFB68_12760 [Xanthobacteraceae bacterium]|nr:hypothetical protein [Xanthobacteraceae bacterium]
MFGRDAYSTAPLARPAVMSGIRVAAALILLALCAGGSSGQDRGKPPSFDPPPKNPDAMRFEWVREGPAEKCGSNCKEWLSAKGTIMPDTGRDFEAFARTRDIAGKVVVLESNGGAVNGGLAFGRALRRLNMTVAVGQTVMLPKAVSGEQRATYSPRAMCASMCPFVLLGGARRHVPSEARILVHQIWPGAARADSTAAIYNAQQVASMLRATSEMARYTVDMGGEIELFDLSMRIPPWEDLRVLTQAEVQRTRLNTIDAPFTTDADAVSSPPPGILPPTGGQQASIARWTLVGEGADRGIVRRHPLTIEGEEVGSLLITFSCGDRPTNMKLRYWETRRLASAGDAITRAVMALNRERIPLTIDSSATVGGRLESTASAMVPTPLVAKLISSNQSSVGVATLTKSKAQTAIRIGTTGLAQVLPQLSSGCPR